MRYEDILTWWKDEKKDTKEDIYTLLDNFKILFAFWGNPVKTDKRSKNNMEKRTIRQNMCCKNGQSRA